MLRPQAHLLVTQLTPAECAERLAAHLTGWPMYRPQPGQPVAGAVSPRGFSLTRAIRYRNSFQTQARGTFTSTEGGTQIRLSLGLSPAVLVFALLWLALVASFLVGGVSGAMTGDSRDPLVLLPFGMLLFGVALVGIGRALARGEDEFLLRFLQTTLHAHELPLDR